MKSKINIMINGLPGNMASQVAVEVLMKHEFITLMPYSFTGQYVKAISHELNGVLIKLIKPDKRDEFLEKIREESGNFITVDYTLPEAVMENAAYYRSKGLPFVMGTTGGDRIKLEETAKDSSICSVIAPNMALEIVALQSFMENFSRTNSLSNCSLQITESHQLGKADTSGTAKAMVTYFNRMGIDFNADMIKMIRDPKVQLQYEVPEEYLKGHAWHTYFITAKEGGENQVNNLREGLFSFYKDNPLFTDYQTISMTPANVELWMPTGRFCFEYSDNTLSITHNINGREVYARGTIKAVSFLHKKMLAGCKGDNYTMIEVSGAVGN